MDLTALSSAAEALLKQLEAVLPQSPHEPSRFHLAGRPLRYSDHRNTLQEGLMQLGCAEASRTALMGVYKHACQEVAAEGSRAYQAAEAELSLVVDDREMATLPAWLEALAGAIEKRVDEAALYSCRAILDEVRSAQARHGQHAPAPPPPPTEEQSGAFTAEALAILNAAFEAAENVSRAERRELAGVTGLTERQILTWFANQRQRRHKKQHRAAPYDLSRRAPHPAQVRRAVSGSSSSSSLVEYAESGAGSSGGSAANWSPTSGMYLGRGDISVGDHSPTGAAFASYAAQFQLPQPPPLPVDVEVPMMEFTQATPLEPAFPPFLSEAPCDELPAPWSITPSTSPESAPPADFFAQALSSSPSSSVSDELYLPPPSFALAPPPMPEHLPAPALLADAWMDDQFYENLFGSLGLDLPGNTSSGAGASAVPGLTLSMEAVRAEQAQLVGGGSGWF